jgi:acyl carrier protein
MLEVEQVLEVLAESLPIPNRVHEMGEHAPLLGAIPELDSMAIVAIITSIEDRFNIVLDDDELDAEVFETVGSLRKLIASKMEN